MQAAPCLDAVAFEDLGDCRSVHAVLAREFPLRGPTLVPLDQLALVLGGQVDLALAFGSGCGLLGMRGDLGGLAPEHPQQGSRGARKLFT